MSWLKDMPGGWSVLSGDMCWEDHGAKWCKKAPDGAWWILRFENAESWGGTGYMCDIHRISLSEVPAEEIHSALSNCGWKIDVDERAIVAPYSGDILARAGEPHFEMVLIDCLDGYGCYSPMGSESGPSYPLRVRAAARRLAESMMDSYAATNQALNRTVNALGSTAAVFGRGDSLAGLRRKADAVLRGEPVELSTADRIILQMYNAADGQTLGGAKEAGLAAAGRALRKD